MIFSLSGWLGALIFIAAYVLLSLQIISSKKVLYHILNLSGAVLLTLNALHVDDFPNVLVNVVWGMIAIVVIINTRKIPKK